MKRLALIALILVAPAGSLQAQSNLAFPHLAIGGNPAYETVLQVINEVETTNPIVIEVFQGSLAGASNGTPMLVRFDGGTAATSLTATLSPFQEFTTILTANTAAIMNGWLRVRSTLAAGGGKISGSLIFRQRSGGSLIDSVGATSPMRFRQGVIQVDQREPGSDTGVACSNPELTPVVISLDLFQGLNPAAVTVPVTLQPNQHYARLVSEIFPSFGTQQGTLILSAGANRIVPCMALRLDSFHLTSIPVRPLGFSFQYTVTSDAGAIVETGYWMFDMVGLNLVGTGKVESPAAADPSEVTGSWVGTNFQFRYRKILPDGSLGMVIFNGTSAGQESTVGSDGKSKAVTGKVTIVGADGHALATYNFTAFHKFGAPPQ